ncbi:hypothetical protein [Pararobbsia silviterrae]|uniref:DUF4239 domain-containing protein n=1 Tax=Pararobbsia silviterrae TaxID=1792498 RepID=A0A494XGA1_9BURK|nr:hypothetical protein [Pararobbsia silviterrae]RKP47114.1 hypothetical protein D7S86_23490 [Pararobbsia silviterrae]
MAVFVDHPLAVLIVMFVVLVAAVSFGAYVLRRRIAVTDDVREDYKVVQAATLTLLALLIGFTLSMAVGRYDQRKNLEENEANAIGTEFVRADLADPAMGYAIKGALIRYTRLRVADFLTRDPQQLELIGRQTSDTQAELWRLATEVAKDKANPIGALVVSGMNDTLNSQDYSEAARINRVPIGAWALLFLIAIAGCIVQGYGAQGRLSAGLYVTLLPFTVSLSLALIADIDSPRGGIIHVQPQNLMRLEQAIH